MSNSLTPGDRRVLEWLDADLSAPVPDPVPEPPKPRRRIRLPRGWPIFIIASPAAVSIWSGWVGLGAMCGFGYVHPLPGIADHFQLDTAITLPIGVEAYGAYALGAWLNPDTPPGARRFARWSALGSLLLGLLGQVAYHLLDAAGYHRAPWPVIIAVSCIPVIALGFGAALAHLLRVPPAEPDETGGVPVPEPPAELNGHAKAAAERFAAELAAGAVPGIRKIRKALGVGQDRAQQVRGYLRDLVSQDGGAPDA